MTAARFELGDLQRAVDDAVALLQDQEAVRRMWEGDHTLWQQDPTECADRLGWLHVVAEMEAAWPDLEALAAELTEDVDHVVVLGMGGSSLFPEVLSRSFPARPDAPRLHVLDTTDPGGVLACERAAPPDRTLYVVSSKSGSTIETRSHLAHFLARTGDPSRFVAVTDPGSPLATRARAEGFRHVFENRADIGGRFSALSYFGLVPAALAGIDGAALLDTASELAHVLGPWGEELHLGVELGAAIAVASQRGRDKLTFLIDPAVASFGLWLEQLIAESTGKHGHGILPVVDEAVNVHAPADDRLFVVIGHHATATALELVALGLPTIVLSFDEPAELGAQVYLWEFATAVAGAVLGLNPFDQPDVQAAKSATMRVLEETLGRGADGVDGAGPGGGTDAASVDLVPLEQALATVGPSDYLAILAFVDPSGDLPGHLEAARLALGRRLGVASTLGLGPRYLHSTGQLHKGGRDNGVFIQVVGEQPHDVGVPGEAFSFGELERAQADGDLAALRERGRRVARVPLQELLDHN